MSIFNHKTIRDNEREELKELKRKSRHVNAAILIGVFQVATIVLSYYLGYTSHAKHID